MRPGTSCVLIGLLAAGVGLVAADTLTPQLADAFERKLVAVQQRASIAPAAAGTTLFAENEVNSYLRFKTEGQLPTGLTEPAFTLIGEGRVTARAVVDLDIIREKQKSSSWLDPIRYLSGKLPVTATGALRTGAGKARIDLESVEVSGVPMPKALLQQLVSYFTKSAERPGGASLDDTFLLPVQIQQLDVQPGRAVVIQ